jgi:hypothetical protein
MQQALGDRLLASCRSVRAEMRGQRVWVRAAAPAGAALAWSGGAAPAPAPSSDIVGTHTTSSRSTLSLSSAAPSGSCSRHGRPSSVSETRPKPASPSRACAPCALSHVQWAPLHAHLCRQALKQAVRDGRLLQERNTAGAGRARAGPPSTCGGASVASGAGGRADRAKRCCRPASTAACDAPTTTAVWPASSGARPGLSTTPRPRMPAPARRELVLLYFRFNCQEQPCSQAELGGRQPAFQAHARRAERALTNAPAPAWATHVHVFQHRPP